MMDALQANYNGGDTIFVHNQQSMDSFGSLMKNYWFTNTDINFIVNENILSKFVQLGWEVEISFQPNLLDTIFIFKSIKKVE